MKKILLFILVLFFTHSVMAASEEEKAPETVNVQVDFYHQMNNQSTQANPAHIQNKFQMLVDNHLWAMLHDRNTQAKYINNLILLTKIQKADAKQVTMNFLILDVKGKPKVVAMPTLVMAYGQKAQLVLNNGSEKIQIGALAKV